METVLKRISVALLIIAIAVSITGCATYPSWIAVPAFFPINGDWDRIKTVGRTVKLIVPEKSFATLVGDGRDDAQDKFDECRANGQLVLGYVSTRNFTRSFAEIQADIDRWYSTYSSHIDGIFFDEGPQFPLNTDAFFRQCYMSIANHVRQTHPEQDVILLNASQFPNEWVLEAADYVIVWEQEKDLYLDGPRLKAIYADGSVADAPPWWGNADYRDRLVHVVWRVPEADLPVVVSRAKDTGAGIVYIYDGTSDDYGRLPSYWDREVQLVRE